MWEIPYKRNGIRPNQYEIKDGVVYLTTRNKPAMVIKFDEKKLKRALMFSWSAHPYKYTGRLVASHRYRELRTGIWREIYLSTQLGFGQDWIHKNGDPLDFTSVNMVRRKGFCNRPCRATD